MSTTKISNNQTRKSIKINIRYAKLSPTKFINNESKFYCEEKIAEN